MAGKGADPGPDSKVCLGRSLVIKSNGGGREQAGNGMASKEKGAARQASEVPAYDAMNVTSGSEPSCATIESER